MLIQYEKPPLPFLKEKRTVIPLQTEFKSSICNVCYWSFRNAKQ